MNQEKAYSSLFDDIYFSPEDGVGESRYVFLEGNALAARFAGVRAFRILELGFGTGLNFFLTVQEFFKFAPEDARLLFVSCEKFPLQVDQIKEWLPKEFIGEPIAFFESFYAHYSTGKNFKWEFTWNKKKVALHLYFQDVKEMFAGLYRYRETFDAVFLDGFAPKKNPEMWSENVLEELSHLLKVEGTFSSFSAAGFIRRALTRLGFEVERRKGFGRKREMLCGKKTRRKPVFWSHDQTFKHIAIVGAGLAGVGVAHALSRRGFNVSLLDRHHEVAQEGSGNAAALCIPLLTAESIFLSRYFLSAYLWSSDLLRSYGLLSSHGVLQILNTQESMQRAHQAFESHFLTGFAKLLTVEEASCRAGIQLQSSALWWEKGGWVSPQKACNVLREDTKNLQWFSNFDLAGLERLDNGWQLKSTLGKTLDCDAVVLACARTVSKLSQSAWIPLNVLRGQVVEVKTPFLENLKMPLSFDGFLTPALEKGHHLLGATYQRNDEGLDVRENDTQELKEKLQKLFPEITTLETSNARAALRVAAPDKLPIVGSLVDPEKYQQRFENLAKGCKERAPELPYQKGLFVSTGHGSRGVVSGLFAGECLANWISGNHLPLPEDLWKALQPHRFLWRQMKHPLKGKMKRGEEHAGCKLSAVSQPIANR